LPFFISPLGGTAVFQRSWSGTDGDGTVTLDGITYDGIGQERLSGLNLADVTLTTEPFQIPPLSDATTVTAQFTLSGRFRAQAFHVPERGDVTLLADVLFTGSGTSTLFLVPSLGATIWQGTRIQFDIVDPTPVPEPSTLMLTGIGVAVLGRRLRRRD
jgi:hypothetical protein